MSVKVICSQGALLLGSLLFFLPFTAVSCQGVKVAELSGMQLALGSHINLPDTIGAPTLQAIPPQSSVTLALALGVIAFFAGFGYRVLGGRILTVLSALGAAAGLLVSRFGGSYEPLAIAAMKAEMRPAYWGAIICYLTGGLISLAALLRPVAPEPEPPARMPQVRTPPGGTPMSGRHQVRTPGGGTPIPAKPQVRTPPSGTPGPGTPPAGTREPMVCPECGTLWVPKQSVCRQCGKSFHTVKS